MKQTHSAIDASVPRLNLSQRLRRSLALTALAMALAIVSPLRSSAQLQYVPVITTYAGGATTSTLCAAPQAQDALGDGCVATSAILAGPTTDDSDAAGNIYFADSTNNVIRRIDAVTGIITVVAGEVGSTALCSSNTDTIGDGCPATQAPLNNPRAVHFDRAGNMVIADVTNEVLRSVNKKTGIITLLMGEIGKTTRTPPLNTKPSTPLTTTLYNPYNFVFDPAGNMIVTNSTGDFVPIALAINGLIDPVNSSVYDLAGTGAAGAGASTDGDGGLASAATFLTPRGVTLDAAGNVYIGDYGDELVRRISSPRVSGQVTAAGIIAATVSAYAGNGTAGSTGDNGPPTSAELATPQGVGFDNAGNLYIQEYSSGNDFIRKVTTATNIINTYAGNGTAAFAGDGGPSSLAEIFTDTGLKFNLGNRMTIADSSNNRIRNSYATPFFISTAVGSTSAAQNAIVQATSTVTPASAAASNTEFAVGTATGCTLGSSLASGAYCTFPITFTPAGPGLRQGQLQIKDSSGNIYNDSLIGVGQAPAAAFIAAPITTITGNGTAGSSGNNAAATAALVNAPGGGAFDSYGNFYFADTGNNVVREISKKTGNIAIVAGTGASGFSGDGFAATTALLNSPAGVAVDAAGNLYIADTGNNRIREVSANTGLISTIAGTGTPSYTGDNGLATAATLSGPAGIAIDNAGTLYIADTGNNVVRAFSPLNGMIVTLAGNGTAGYSGDAGVPTSAQLNAPAAVTVDLSGNIYIADTGNAVVRQLVPLTFGIINFQANINTYAGTAGSTTNSGDGGAATAAGLKSPGGLGVDAAGDLYIAAGGQVRMVNPSGIITTIAGTGASGVYSGEGGSATSAVIPSAAKNLAVDAMGNVYLSDTAGNRILHINGPTAAPLTFASQTTGTTSTAQTVTLYNSGNASLSITNISVSANFVQSNSASNACTTTTTLVAGGSCVLTISFAPVTQGSITGTVTITDNALNNAASTQTISLSGTGAPPAAPLNPTTTVVTYAPAVPVYGQTVTLTATVSGGTNTSGNVSFTYNGTTVTAPVSQTQATYQVTGLVTGHVSVSATYLGDTANAGSMGTTSFTVQPAVLTVTASNASIYPTQAIPAFGYTITGFVYKDTATSATSGAPTISTTATTSSPVGTYPITPSLGTLTASNYTFTFVPGTLTIIPATFTLTVSPSSLTIVPGQVGAVTATITPTYGYSGTVNLSCNSLPADALCTFTLASVPVSNNLPVAVLLTISTDNYSHISSSGRPWNQSKWFSLAFLMPFLSFAMFFRSSARRRWLSRGLWVICLLVLLHGLNACAPGVQDTAAYSGNVVVVATDTTANITSQATIALTVP